MQKILKTIVIPLLILMAVMGLFGAGWWWGATHTQVFAGMARGRDGEGWMRPGFEEQRLRPGFPQSRFGPEGFEGRQRGPSLLRGLGGVFGSLLKLAAIVLLVLLVQRGLTWFDAWRASRQTPPAVPPASPPVEPQE